MIAVPELKTARTCFPSGKKCTDPPVVEPGSGAPISFLVATSSLYAVLEVLYLLAPLLALCMVLIGLGSYLVMRAILRIQGYDRKIKTIEESDVIVRDLLDID